MSKKKVTKKVKEEKHELNLDVRVCYVCRRTKVEEKTKEIGFDIMAAMLGGPIKSEASYYLCDNCKKAFSDVYGDVVINSALEELRIKRIKKLEKQLIIESTEIKKIRKEGKNEQ